MSTMHDLTSDSAQTLFSCLNLDGKLASKLGHELEVNCKSCVYTRLDIRLCPNSFFMPQLDGNLGLSWARVEAPNETP